MAQFTYEAYESEADLRGANSSQVSYFTLRDDGDEAVVRFVYNSPAELNVNTVHDVIVDGKHRKVSCLRASLHEPAEKCPLCATGNKLLQKFYVRLVEYTRNDQQEIVPVGRIWERPASFSGTLKGYFDEGYVLADCLFKIKRHGRKGDMNTTYEILPAHPSIYKPEIYPRADELFNGYTLSTYVVMEKTFDEIANFVRGIPFPSPIPAAQTAQPIPQPTPNQYAPRPAYNPNPYPQQTAPVYNPAPQAQTAPAYQAQQTQQTAPVYVAQQPQPVYQAMPQAQPTAPTYNVPQQPAPTYAGTPAQQYPQGVPTYTAPQQPAQPMPQQTAQQTAPADINGANVKPGRRYTY